MQSRSGVVVVIFLITMIFMCITAILLPEFSGQGRTFLMVSMVVLGAILAGILSALVLSMIKAAPLTTEKLKEQEVRTEPTPAPVSDEKLVQILSVLQRKGRLIDFLQEDISRYEDSQIGAAVRNIHKGCSEAIAEHVILEPVMKEAEGSNVTIQEGFDPSAVRLTGNVAGSPPFRGVVRHSGWKVVRTALPALPKNQDRSIIEPAEIELA
jgi:hypothetical protein